MRKNFVPKYRYYTNGKNIVVAVASYAGQTIRGVAKCSEQDEFDLEIGKELAAARCAVKIAKAREIFTKSQRDMWQDILARYTTMYERWDDKHLDAIEIKKQAEAKLNDIMKGLS